jgi:TatD DNase family protein
MSDLPVAPPEALPAQVIDSHVHLDITTDFSGLEVSTGLTAAAQVGVSGAIQVGVDLPSSQLCVALAKEHSHVLGAAIGVHPNEAPKRLSQDRLAADLDELAGLAQAKEVVAIGETGLDFFRTGPDGAQAQIDSFREHIRLARDAGLTLVIHDRDAHSAVLEVLNAEDLPERVVFHCFSGDEQMARVVAEAGWFLSFSGVVTFKNAQGLRSALEAVPESSILVETDAPFLTPAPNRGKPNASYLMPNSVREIARVRDQDLATMCGVLTANTIRAFGLDPGQIEAAATKAPKSVTG